MTDRARKKPGNVIAQARSNLGCPCQQKVASQNCLQVAPLCIDRFDTTTGDPFVHDVIVVQRSKVHEFARNATQDHIVGHLFARANLGRSNGHHGAQALAAGNDEVTCNLGEIRVTRADRMQHGGFHPITVEVHIGEVKKWRGNSHASRLCRNACETTNEGRRKTHVSVVTAV